MLTRCRVSFSLLVSARKRQFAVQLRDYQEECLQACLRAYHKDKIYRQAVSLPVGSGKTMIFANLISRLCSNNNNDNNKNGNATKSLVLAHREELLDQAATMISRVNPDLKVVIEQGKSRADPSTADVIVASVPTLGRRDSRRLEKYIPDLFKCVIIDEAHHAAADSYLRILDHFGLLSDTQNCDSVRQRPLLWGCSATLSRYDDLPLGRVFDKIVYHIDLMRVMQAGHLCPLKTVQIDTDLIADGGSDEINVRNGDYDLSQLSLAIDTPKRNQLIVDTWNRVAREQHKRHSTIVFGLNLQHVENMAHHFSAITTPAVITGDTIDSVRRDILYEYQRGRIEVLLNCAVLTEGTDLPRTDCILLTRPTCNANLYVQMVGRGLRRHDSKQYCLLLDVVDKWKTNRGGNGRSLITFPSLLPHYYNPDCNDDTNNITISDSNINKRQHTDAMVSRLKVRLSTIDYNERIVDLQGHRLAWIPVSPHLFLCGDGRGKLAVLRVDESASFASIDYVVDKHRTITISPPGSRIHEALEQLCVYLHQSGLTDRFTKDSPWRRHPISTAQLRFINTIATSQGAPDAFFKELCRWTVGQASDYITRHVWMREHKMRDDDTHEAIPSVCLIRKKAN